MAIEVAAPPASKAVSEAAPAAALAESPPVDAIGVLGGTFDPIHFGHLRLAEEIADGCGLAQVRVIPSGIPPHRRAPRASAQQRFDMVCAAVTGNARLVADQSEIFREQPCFTVDTLTGLRAEFGAQTPICLMLGVDAFLALPTWHCWQRLFELTHIVVAQRPGYTLDQSLLPAPLVAEFEARYIADARSIHDRAHGIIVKVAITALDISATGVRAHIAARRSARYLLPDIVLDYIQANTLYQGEP
ncbi:MAG: nicotinate-nucleotide adenylyltransferase [Burkholderiales bacterium]|nr:nicotinate-nucleotide adenylyltransferase [Burkholderiales bacterium]MDQ3195244.1 nicotinate-nucleotide adenylyltransferase [Pseudomonadota bacterium]